MSEKRTRAVAAGATVALGEPDELIALLAAGIDVRPCRSAEELEKQLEGLAGRQDVGLVLVTERAAQLNQEVLDDARRAHGLVILVVPTLKSHRRMSEQALSRLLEQAAGADLLAREAEEGPDEIAMPV